MASNKSQQQQQSDDAVSCPICLSPMKEAFMTSCGHSFCYLCISRHLETKSNCPLCSSTITRTNIFPNLVLNDVITRARGLTPSSSSSSSTPINHQDAAKQLEQSITESGSLSISDINTLVSQLLERRKQLQDDEKDIQLEVLAYFLNQAKDTKLESVKNLTADIDMLTRDIQSVEAQRLRMALDRGPDLGMEVPPSLSQRHRSAARTTAKEDTEASANNINNKKRRLAPYLNDLETSYFSDSQRLQPSTSTPLSTQTSDSSISTAVPHSSQREELSDSLSAFSDQLSKVSKFSRFKVHATTHYDTTNTGSNIVSSIEFDRDSEYFAAAGVTKKIKIYEYESIVRHPDASHFALHELTCCAKLSCLSWNSYVKCQLAASDYDGVVWLWDVFAGCVVARWDEHERRIWSVDFSKSDPTRLASGSDDGKVKIWTTNQESAAATLLAKANVCCVQFHPKDANQVVFGCADHQIQWFDLRHIRAPLHVFKDHKKAVSYVKFLGPDEIVSASTDSTLKLWSVPEKQCIRTFQGHKNEKNFVGLSTNGEFIACGSETNSVHAFLRLLSTPVVSHDFSPPQTQREPGDEGGSHFVSSLCWRQKSNVLVVGNSQGMISVLELV